VRAFRRWFLGEGEYVHPALKWASWPLFRLGMLVFIVAIVASGGDGSTAWLILVLSLLGVSLVADLANDLLVRARRSRARGKSS
jgi:hypothetical protein